jgi:citrate lyase subunit beta/citryl-CoA lyase
MKQLRRTMLYVPGNNPGMIRDAHIYGSDCIMFDLEDSVSIREKDAARFLVFNALYSLDYGNKELVVRVNALDSKLGISDLEAIVRTRKAIIRLPKTESAQDVWDCAKEIARIEGEIGVEIGSTKMMAAIESAQGVLNAQEIAKSSKRLIGIAIGAEDYVTDLKTSRSPEGMELLFGRSMVLLAARAAKIDAIDTVYSDINNEDGFRQEVRLIKQLGFDGKSVINPKQIAPVHEIFTPTEKEIKKSLAIVTAIEQAQQRGSGVIALNGKMIDKPVAERAIHLLDLARASGALKEGDELNA